MANTTDAGSQNSAGGTIHEQSPSGLAKGYESENNMELKTMHPTSYPSQQQPSPGPDSTNPPKNHVTSPEDLSDKPAFVDCPWCKSRQQTRVVEHASTTTKMAAMFCCLICACFTVWIPLACHWCASVDHECSKCGNVVAHRPYDGKMEARHRPPNLVSNYS